MAAHVIAEVQAAQRGDLVAYEELVRHWQAAVCAIGLSVTRDVAESEDVAQEVFITAWQRLGTLREPASFGPWVRQIARNVAMTRRRSRRRYEARVTLAPDAVDQATTDIDPVLAAERDRVVQEALEALPDDARDVMVLYYREGRDTRQVADLLGISEAAVRKRLSRARIAVRGDVLARFDVAVRVTAPTAALATAVVATLSPSSALAAAGVAKVTGISGIATAGLAIVGLFLGYGLAERVVPHARVPILRRARNLSALGLAIAGVCIPFGKTVMLPGMVACVGLLAYVQFAELPRAFAASPDADARALRAAWIGTLCGALGWAGGGFFGMWAALS